MKTNNLVPLMLTVGASLTFLFNGCGGPTTTPTATNASNARNDVVNSNNAANNTAAAPTGTVAPICSSQMDKQIIDGLVAAYGKDPDIQPQMKHFNATSVDCKVTLYGYAEPSKAYDAVIMVTSQANGIKGLDVLHFADNPKGSTNHGENCGCPPNTHACGDICIPDGEDCMLGPCIVPASTPKVTPTR